MKHDNDNRKFPSGRHVDRCRRDAKKLVKEHKSAGQELRLSKALDMVAIINGIRGGWAEAMNHLEKEAACTTN